MAEQVVFKRVEMKYMLTKDQQEKLLIAMQGKMQLDSYGKHTIKNIYLDTDDFLLIRRSIEKPVYKEKLRIRGYNTVTDDSRVFIEIKKKFKHIVYKRRIPLDYKSTMKYFENGQAFENECQITHEIDYFMNFYEHLTPKVLLMYDREAYFTDSDPNFRMTFDTNVNFRCYDIDLSKDADGQQLLEQDKIILEVKTTFGLPAWLNQFFAENKIYKTSFSKYGTVYKNHILANTNKFLGVTTYVQ